MKSFVRKMSVVSMLALSSFTATSIVQPANAHAIIGAAAFPLFPLIIVGAALEVVAVGTGTAAVIDHCAGLHRRGNWLAGVSATTFVVGLLFLDDNKTQGEVKQLSAQEGAQYGLSDTELQAYNQAVADGSMEAVFQTAVSQLSENSSHDQAKDVMQNLLGALDNDAHTAFVKIAQHQALTL